MTVNEFLEERQIPDQYIEELEDKIIIKHPTCRITLYKRMLDVNMLAGEIELHLKDTDTKNDFCTDIENKIDIGNLLFVFSLKGFGKEAFPPEVIGNLLDWKIYDMTSADPFWDRATMYALVGSESDLAKFNDKDTFQLIEGGIYKILR